MRMKFWSLFIAFFTLALFYEACVFSVHYDGGKFACKSDKDCPPDFQCFDKLCYPQGSEPPNPCDDGGCKKEPKPRQPCQSHADCQLSESCRPDIDGQGKFCVPRCNVITQVGCARGEVCVLWEKRGYCREMRGASRLGHLCKEDFDCELHLYCRSVKGFPNIKRCAKTCDLKKGCTKKGQRCLPLRPEDRPIGYCEPLPTIVKENGICGGDLVCEKYLVCRKEEGDQYKRCHISVP